MINKEGGMKSMIRPNGDHSTHFWNCIHNPFVHSWIFKYLNANEMMKKRLKICVLSTMVRNMYKGNQLIMDHKALKCVRANNGWPNGLPYKIPMIDGMTLTSPSWLQWL